MMAWGRNPCWNDRGEITPARALRDVTLDSRSTAQVSDQFDRAAIQVLPEGAQSDGILTLLLPVQLELLDAVDEEEGGRE